MPMPVEIVTPERVVWQSEADSIVIPASEGELGILPHHVPLIAQMQPGEIRIRTGVATRFVAVSGGFIEVLNNHVSIFAETAERAEEIDAERARQAAERARLELAEKRSRTDMWQAEIALRRALARLRAHEAFRRTSAHSAAHRG